MKCSNNQVYNSDSSRCNNKFCNMDDYFYTITYNEKIFSINDEELLDVIPVRLIIAKLKQIKAKNNWNYK